ncbi:MAG: DHH family phosphoesterase, partial [Candidatus Saccharimonadales bacterium]
SVVILGEAIQNAGGRVELVMFPDRERDGYGLNANALTFLRGKSPALLITLDLGISNVKEIAEANKMGFEVIVIDHHKVLDQLPPASIVVDPQQEERDTFKNLCNAGLTFKLAEELLGDAMSDGVRRSLLELAALATISDMVAQVGDNKKFIEAGLRSLPDTFRPGLAALRDAVGRGTAATPAGVGKIISALNAAESIDFANESYELLTAAEPNRCRDLAETLLARSRQKQQQVQTIAQEVERRVSAKPQEPIIFEGDPAWKLVLAGSAASALAPKYGKPVFIFKRGDTESVGSVRSLQEGQNSVEAMKTCADLLITYGGHPKASGFRLKNENLEAFKQCLTDYFKKNHS